MPFVFGFWHPYNTSGKPIGISPTYSTKKFDFLGYAMMFLFTWFLQNIDLWQTDGRSSKLCQHSIE